MIGVYSTFVWFGDQAHVINDEAKSQSKTYPILAVIPGKALAAFEVVKPVFQEFWDQSIEMMDRLEDLSIEKTENNSVYDLPENEEN
ncbi:MAG TPA: hypothetical protein ENJ45_02045 [Phaeodactylibacter sp.]|nr:hypothetical protein [Phaeodactylibacter sp.]